MTTNGIARDPDATPVKITEPVPLSAAIDGGNNHGMIVLDKATEIAIDKCKKHGVGVVGTNHTFTSTGALGYYAKKIGDQGMVGVVLAQSPEFVAPAGSKQAILGTNPIGCSIPRKGGEPMTLDMATSAYAFFGLLEAKTSTHMSTHNEHNDPMDVGSYQYYTDRKGKGKGLGGGKGKAAKGKGDQATCKFPYKGTAR